MIIIILGKQPQSQEWSGNITLKSYTRNFMIAHGSWTFPKSNWFWSIVLWDHREGMWCASCFGPTERVDAPSLRFAYNGLFWKGRLHTPTLLLSKCLRACLQAYCTHCIVDIRWLHKWNRVAFTGPIVIRPSMLCGNWHGWSSLLESSKGY